MSTQKTLDRRTPGDFIRAIEHAAGGEADVYGFTAGSVHRLVRKVWQSGINNGLDFASIMDGVERDFPDAGGLLEHLLDEYISNNPILREMHNSMFKDACDLTLLIALLTSLTELQRRLGEAPTQELADRIEGLVE